MNSINQVATIYRSANSQGQAYFLDGNEYWSEANICQLPIGWYLAKDDCYDEDEEDDNEIYIMTNNNQRIEAHDIQHHAQTNQAYVLINGQAIILNKVN